MTRFCWWGKPAFLSFKTTFEHDDLGYNGSVTMCHVHHGVNDLLLDLDHLSAFLLGTLSPDCTPPEVGAAALLACGGGGGVLERDLDQDLLSR